MFRLFLHRRNAYNFSKKTLGENKKSNRVVCENISMKVENMEYLK